MKTRLAVLAVLVAAALTIQPGGEGRAEANQNFELRIATLAPDGSTWMRVFNAWKNTLNQETNGRLKLKFYPGGSQGDEKDFVRKMVDGQMDGAAVTSTGLGQIVKPVLVLQAPGIFEEYRQIDRVRSRLSSDFEQQFADAGYTLLGWGDAGKARLFSNKPINKPEDLKGVRPWAWTDDPMFKEFLRVVGANGVSMGVPEVLGALQTDMVDTVPASALAAVSLQWYTRVTHVTKQTDAVLVGATIVKKDKVEALPADLQQALRETAERAHGALKTQIRTADDRAYEAIKSRGVTEVDLSANRDAWRDAAQQVRTRLAGRLYSRQLLQQVENAAGN